MDQLDEIVLEFLTESHEGLDQMERHLVELEQKPDDKELLKAIFRSIHTIKGTCGFLGFTRLESVTHHGESLLALLRDGLMRLTPEVTSLLLRTVDTVRGILATIEAQGHDGKEDHAELIADLDETIRTHGRRKGEGHGPPADPEPGEVEVATVAEAVADAVAVPASTNGDGGSSVTDSTIRVDVELLDRLMTQVGELVLSRNQILQYAIDVKDTAFQAASQRLNLITTELQEGVMKTRMQPIGNVWQKFPRVVRDLSVSFGKEVRIEMLGRDTELDKTIIEAIKDPLTHLIRNAVDHGIESPEDREAAGKPREGVLRLRAFHEGGQVNIEIADDGAGIDTEAVKHKALDKGLVSPDQVARMTERELQQLLFLPGLSTAKTVTNVSGRGVGMDVVKTNIEKIGGMVDMQSVRGEGTVLKIKIPLTLAIIPALVVTSQGERFAIPQVNLLELVRLEEGIEGLEEIHGVPVYRLRGELLPIVHLDQVLSLHKTKPESEKVDFDALIAAHHAWRSRLDRIIAGDEAVDRSVVTDPAKCALGKWLYGAGKEQFGKLAEWRLLEGIHRRMHESLGLVIDEVEAGETALAKSHLGTVDGLIRETVADIEKLREATLSFQDATIVVLRADDRSFGLVVDEVNETTEIVVKPLGKQLKGIPVFAGATVMGDGRVALILDVLGLAQEASVVSTTGGERHVTGRDAASQLAEEDRDTLLILGVGESQRVAIPIAMVARLEEVPRRSLEVAGEQEVIQYRDSILPLLRLSNLLGSGGTGDDPDNLQLVVYNDDGREVGIVVDRILDIVEDRVAVEKPSDRPGLIGSAVVQGRITDLLDIRSIVRNVHGGAPEFSERTA